MATVNRGDVIEPLALADLATLGNLKLAPTVGYAFTAGIVGVSDGNYLTVLNRMRTDLFAKYGIPGGANTATRTLNFLEAGHPPAYAKMRLKTVSGPWVVRTVGATGGSLDVDGDWEWSDVEFWYASSLTPNFQVSTGYFSQSGQPQSVHLVNALNNEDGDGYYPSYTAQIRIGGTLTGILTANTIIISSRQKTSGGGSALNVTSDLPGGISVTYSTGGGVAHATITLPAAPTAPGLYTLSATEASNWGFGAGADGFIATALKLTVGSPPIESGMNAIEQSGLVNRVKTHADDSSESGGWPFGIHIAVGPSADGLVDYTDVVTGEKRLAGGGSAPIVVYQTSNNLWTVSCEGLFVAKTIPVDRENTEIDLQVPFTRLPGPNSRMRIAAPPADTATVKAVTPAVSYRVGRYPCTKDDAGSLSFGATKGMCVYAVTVRRPSAVAGNGIYLPPASKPAMTVQVGYYVGASFRLLGSVILATGEMEGTIYPFWPVFGPIPLRYQVAGDASADAVVQVYANYQPPYMGPENSLNPNCTYPVAACLYNDLWNALSNLPVP